MFTFLKHIKSGIQLFFSTAQINGKQLRVVDVLYSYLYFYKNPFSFDTLSLPKNPTQPNQTHATFQIYHERNNREKKSNPNPNQESDGIICRYFRHYGNGTQVKLVHLSICCQTSVQRPADLQSFKQHISAIQTQHSYTTTCHGYLQQQQQHMKQQFCTRSKTWAQHQQGTHEQQH